ncbi:hypothetical protein PAB09_00205 [Corynebacterium sp. SCR221107]|uniref:hypothetical protein n=1 Tax=Corynebacterium sp. SCR221107 TaxID=3017361 RepID=UPI0022EC5AE9|nr:hypothetical protein [Corynebacterium sp. SCR221107]WBT08825.1 hypothetical protein PAB09_00205 [Corynebacterium sp. SCR221107]
MATAMGIAQPASSTGTTKTVTLPAGTTGGTWTLIIDGKTTAGIPFDADGAAVTSALAAAQSTATAQGSAGGPFTITGATNVSANGNNLTGGDTAITIN